MVRGHPHRPSLRRGHLLPVRVTKLLQRRHGVPGFPLELLGQRLRLRSHGCPPFSSGMQPAPPDSASTDRSNEAGRNRQWRCKRRARPILRLRSLCSLCSLRHQRLLGPVLGTVCLARRDSHADQGAVATQFSSSTGAGTSPTLILTPDLVYPLLDRTPLTPAVLVAAN